MRFKWLVMGLCLAVVAAPATAQSYWGQAGTDQVSLELARPTLSGDGLTVTSMALFAAGSYSLGDNLALAIDLPFVRAQFDIADAESSSSIGNPYLGVEWGLPQFGLQVTGGARLPLAKSELDRIFAQAVGIVSTIDRMEAFMPETATLQASAVLTREVIPSFHVAARLGANVAVYTDTEDEDDSADLYSVYGAQGWYQTGPVRVGGGLLGRLLVTGAEDTSFSDNSLHEAGLWVDYAFGPTRTGINFRFPLDDAMSDMMDFTVGLYVSYRLGR